MAQQILKGIPTSSSDWSLYSVAVGADDAAMTIAQTLSDSIRANFTVDIALDEEARDHARNIVFKELYTILDDYSNFGATDGEALDVATRIINKAFPKPQKFDW